MVVTRTDQNILNISQAEVVKEMDDGDTACNKPEKCKSCIWLHIIDHPLFKPRADQLIEEYLTLWDTLRTALPSPAEVETNCAHKQGDTVRALKIRQELYPMETRHDNPHVQWQEGYMTREEVTAAYHEMLAIYNEETAASER